MLLRLRTIFRRALEAYNTWSNETHRKLFAYKAAHAFLAAPTHEILFEPLTPCTH